MRWALSGHQVIIGSRDAERARSHANQLNKSSGSVNISGMGNPEAAERAEIIVLSVPYSAHRHTLESVQSQLVGKILVDITVPLVPPAVNKVHLPEGGSAGLEAQAILSESVRVVSAFQNVGQAKLQDPRADIECDVLVCGDDAEAKQAVLKLVEDGGMRGIDAGPLANSIAAESLTPVLVHINKTYKVKGAGIRITGLE